MCKWDFPQAAHSLGRHRRSRRLLLLRTNCCVTSVCRKRETDMRKISVMGGDVSQSCFFLSNLHFPNVSCAVFDRKLSVQTNAEKRTTNSQLLSYVLFLFFSNKLKGKDLISLTLYHFKPAQPYQYRLTPISHKHLTPVKWFRSQICFDRVCENGVCWQKVFSKNRFWDISEA